MKKSLLSLALLTALSACSGDVEMSHNKPQVSQDTKTLAATEVVAATDNYQAMLDKFITVDMQADLSSLSDIDKQVLRKLISVADVLDKVYLEQTYENNAEI